MQTLRSPNPNGYPPIDSCVIPATTVVPADVASLAQQIGEQFSCVVLAPLGTGADDRDRLKAVIDVCAANKWPLYLIGTYSIKTMPDQHFLANDLILHAEDCVFDCTLPGGGWEACPFTATFTEAASGHTTLHAANTVGTKVLTTHAAFVAGDAIMPHDLTALAYRRQIYYVDSCVDNGDGTFTVTVDRTIWHSFDVDDEVRKIASHPKNIKLYLRGATIRGVFTRPVNLTGAHNCYVEMPNVDASQATNCGGPWDEGCYNCTSVGGLVDGAGTGAGDGGTIETCDNVWVYGTTYRRMTGHGLLINDSCNCGSYGVTVDTMTVNGIVVGSTDAAKGCRDVRVAASNIVGCVQGVLVDNASTNTMIDSLTVRFCTVGLQIDHTADGTKVNTAELTDCSQYGLAMVNTPTGTTMQNVICDRCILAGIRAVADVDIRGYKSRECGAVAGGNIGGISIDGGTPTVRISDYEISSTLAAQCAVISVAGRLELRNGKITTKAGGYCIQCTGGGIVVRESTVCAGGAGAYSYVGAAGPSSTLYNGLWNSITGCPNGDYFSGVNDHHTNVDVTVVA